MSRRIRIVMFGTGDFAVPTFKSLCESRHEMVALVTQPDRPQGRKQELIPSLIKTEAVARGITVHQPEDVNAPEGLESIRALEPDLLVTAAYGQILSAALLSIPPMGGINLHGSVLPKYRGAAPVARAIENGDTESGVTVIRMTPKIDAGGMIAVARTPIDPNETAGALEDRLALLGAPLILEAIESILAGTAQVIPQDKALVTKAPKLTKESGIIRWDRSARRIHDLVRAMHPWPGASTTWHRTVPREEDVRLLIHETEPVAGAGEPGRVIEAEGDRFVVAAGDGALRLLKVQLVGKKACSAEEFLRGHKPLGDRLGS